jgi:hypothetical protein
VQSISRIATRAALALLVLLLAACAGRVAKPETAEEQVRARSQERWALMIARDFDAAYAYLTPGTRLLHTQKDFYEKYRDTRVDWKSAEVRAVLCETADRCAVKVEVAFALAGGMRGVPNGGGSHVINEVWLLEEGRWYYLPGT